MSANEYDTLQLVGRHLPADNSGPFKTAQEAQTAGYDTLNPVTGVYQIGVLVDGGFVPIIEEQAAHYFHLVGVAKQNAPQQDAPPADGGSQPAQQ